MKVSQLYVYPIKSIRGTQVEEAVITKTGFEFDRSFCLQKVVSEGDEERKQNRYSGGWLKNMHVPHHPEMSLFSTKLLYSDNELNPFRRPHSVMITYTPSCNGTKQDPRSFPRSDRSDSKTLVVPLTPATEDLEILEVNMHGTKTKAYLMPAEISSWFSGWFGYDVKLAYIGKNSRGVLGSLDPGLNKPSHEKALAGPVGLSAKILDSKEPVKISFADCAEYLVVTEQSLQDASSRLPDGEDMDITKFRPNIVVSDDKIQAWDEDFWAAISVTSHDQNRSPQCDRKRIQIEFTANCVRCASLNVDYATGAMGKGASGQILRRLKADRIVDRGATFSPVFGRYGFLKEGLGDVIRVGSGVSIEGFNKERDAFDWPGLAGIPK